MRRRIMALVVGMTALVVIAFAVPLTILIRNNVRNDAVDDARREAGDIARALFQYRDASATTALTSYVAGLDHDRDASVQLPSGQIIGTLPPGGLASLPAPPNGSRSGRPGQPDNGSTTGGRTGSGTPGGTGDDGNGGGSGGGSGGPGDPTPVGYRGGTLVQLSVPVSQQGPAIVRVWASDAQLHAGETTPLLLLAGASLLLLVVGVVAGEILTRRIVRPLLRTADTAGRLSVGDTSARAPTGGPREVGEVGVALNRLADRIDELIAEERETVADLSHRLRTPLTAMRLDAEALHDRDEARRMGEHVSVLERTLTAVIHAARRPQREGRMPSCDATAVVRDRVEFWSALAEDQGRAVDIALPDAPLPVRCAAEDLGAAVDALLENVIAHTPEGTPFRVGLSSVTGGAGGAELEISDDGPGLPRDAVERGRSDRGSTGLGLSIARRCAEAAGGALDLAAGPSGGACVRLRLGAP